MLKKFVGIIMVTLFLICGHGILAAQAEDVCRNRSDVIRVVKNAALSRPDSITFRFDSSLHQHISDADWMGELLPYADIINAQWRYSSTDCTLHHISYMEMVQCETADDVKWALQNVHSSPLALHLTPSLYAELSQADFAGLEKLQGEAGVHAGFRYYSEPRCVVLYEDIQVSENFIAVSSLQQLKDTLFACTERLQENITLHLPRALFDQLTAEDNHQLAALENNCGILKRNMRYYPDSQLVEYTNITYYPGKRVVAAARMNNLYMLSDEEMRLYNTAVDMINNQIYPYAADAYTYVLLSHDAIAQRVSYEKDRYMSDTAVGALLYGAADCDGYADSLYLLCNLAGIECHYQHGDALNVQGETSHMWNGVRLGDAFYCTDVTWDDQDETIHYGFMNMGLDKVARAYIWDTSVALFAPAQNTAANLYYYQREGCAFRSVSDAQAYLKKEASQGNSRIFLMLTHDGAKTDSQAVESVMDGLNIGGRYLYKSVGNDVFICFLPR